MKVAISVLLLMLPLISRATAETIHFGEPQYHGSGCPAGGFSLAVAPDGSAFSVLYDKMEASVAGRHRVEVKSCVARVPVDLPPGMRLTVSRMEYRGFAGLSDPQSWAQLSAAYGFYPRDSAEARRPSSVFFAKTIRGPTLGDFFTSTDELHRGRGATAQSGCGGRVYLYLNASLLLLSWKGAEARFSLDGVDSAGRIDAAAKGERCRP